VASVTDLIATGKLQVGDGYRAKNSELGQEGIPFARAGNINDGFLFDGADRFPREHLHRLGNKISRPGDVVFTSKGTVGRFAFVGDTTPQFVYSPQLCFWRSLDRAAINPRFLFYWMSGPEFRQQFKSVAGQTDMAEYVSLGDQRRMHIELPPIREQNSIADTLGRFDDQIFRNRRQLSALEALAALIFKSWFIDFDPVRAKMEARHTELRSEVSDLFPNILVESVNGLIPQGWRYETFSRLADTVRKSRNPIDELEQIFEYYSIPAFDATGLPMLQVGSQIKSSKFSVPSNSVLLCKLNPEIDRVWFIHNADENAICSTEFIVLVPRKPFAQSFIYSLVRATNFRNLLVGLVTGTSKSHQRVQPDSLAGLTVLVPPDKVVRAFDATVKRVFQRISNLRDESHTLQLGRDGLLPKLISGAINLAPTSRNTVYV